MKKLNLTNTVLLLIVAFFILSCNSNTNKNRKKYIESKTSVKYAKGFDIQYFDTIIKLIINKPYQGANSQHEYILVRNRFETPTLKVTKNIIQIPVKKVIATSTTHIPMIEALEEENSLIGFPNTNYISSKKTRKLIDKGVIQEIGMDANLNTEIVIDLNPDLIIGFSVNGTNKSLETLKRAGIPIIYNGAWLEETPLGRAEWLKFFGVLYDKKEMADSIFNEIEKNYLEIKSIASKKDQKPTILSGAMFKDVWNIPAGDSFMAHFFKDANTNYLWKDTKGTGSLQLNFENILDTGQQADLWIGPGSFTTKEDLFNSNPHYANFKAFKSGNIYTFSKKKGATGGIVYYELGALRPDLILKDIIKISYPDLLKNEPFSFFDTVK